MMSTWLDTEIPGWVAEGILIAVAAAVFALYIVAINVIDRRRRARPLPAPAGPQTHPPPGRTPP